MPRHATPRHAQSNATQHNAIPTPRHATSRTRLTGLDWDWGCGWTVTLATGMVLPNQRRAWATKLGLPYRAAATDDDDDAAAAASAAAWDAPLVADAEPLAAFTQSLKHVGVLGGWVTSLKRMTTGGGGGGGGGSGWGGV